MKRRSLLFMTIAAGVTAAAGLALSATAEGHIQTSGIHSQVALLVFRERVDAYVALHRHLAPPPAAMSNTDPLSGLFTRRYLATAIRGLRGAVDQGDIFTAEAATVFRQLLANSIGERDGETFLAELSGARVVPRGLHPTVNEPYSMAPVLRMPPEVALGLPRLPAELDYRIAAHDLLLWDICAGIVVDFVPDAFVARVVTE